MELLARLLCAKPSLYRGAKPTTGNKGLLRPHGRVLVPTCIITDKALLAPYAMKGFSVRSGYMYICDRPSCGSGDGKRLVSEKNHEVVPTHKPSRGRPRAQRLAMKHLVPPHVQQNTYHIFVVAARKGSVAKIDDIEYSCKKRPMLIILRPLLFSKRITQQNTM